MQRSGQQLQENSSEALSSSPVSSSPSDAEAEAAQFPEEEEAEGEQQQPTNQPAPVVETEHMTDHMKRVREMIEQNRRTALNAAMAAEEEEQRKAAEEEEQRASSTAAVVVQGEERLAEECKDDHQRGPPANRLPWSRSSKFAPLRGFSPSNWRAPVVG